MEIAPMFTWDSEKGIATCILNPGNKQYIASAQCCEQDKDMQSERTGYEIALRKAEILYLKDLKKEYRIKYTTLNHLYSTVKLSPRFNPDSFEGKAILRELKNASYDYICIKEILAERIFNLKEYISKKDAFYKRVRLGRFQKNQLTKNS